MFAQKTSTHTRAHADGRARQKWSYLCHLDAVKETSRGEKPWRPCLPSWRSPNCPRLQCGLFFLCERRRLLNREGGFFFLQLRLVCRNFSFVFKQTHGRIYERLLISCIMEAERRDGARTRTLILHRERERDRRFTPCPSRALSVRPGTA